MAGFVPKKYYNLKYTKETVCALFFFLNINCIKSQEVKFSFDIGSALGKMKYLKKQMLYTEAFMGYETRLGNTYHISFSIGVSNVKFDYYDVSVNQVYNQKMFLTIPVEVKKYISISGFKNMFFIGAGLYASYCFLDKKEIRNYIDSETKTESFTGFNLSIMADFGFKFYLSPKSSTTLAFLNAYDIADDYSNNLNKIKFEKLLFSITYAKRI